MTTDATLAHHLQAILEQSVDTIVSDFTEESILFTQGGIIVGLEGIRAFFERFLGDAPPELFAALQIVRQDVHGEVAYLLWKAEPFVTLATDTLDRLTLLQQLGVLAVAHPAAEDCLAPEWREADSQNPVGPPAC